MFSSHPIVIMKGPQSWQVLPCNDEGAKLFAEGRRRMEDAPGKIIYHVLNEHNGQEVLPWREAKESGERFWFQDTVPCGGPYRLEVCAKLPHQDYKDCIGGDIARNFYAGDLFLIAGQSNAVGYAHDTVEDMPEPGVSVFHLDGTWDMATHPLNDGTHAFFKNLDNCIPGHSPWLTFAKEIRKATGRPVGLIPAAVGGAPLDCWMPGELLYKNALEMIQSTGPIRGVLWYQGCADAMEDRTEDYLERFLQMVQTFRKRMGNETLPFFTCQLNGYVDEGHRTYDDPFSRIRFLQEKAAEEAGIYVLPTAGLRLYDQIHNCAQSNIIIGRQMASQALHHMYGKTSRAEPLKVLRAVKSQSEIVLTVGPLCGELVVDAESVLAFCARDGEREVTLESIHGDRNEIHLTGMNLEKIQVISYGQGTELTYATIHDSIDDWMLMPFAISV